MTATLTHRPGADIFGVTPATAALIRERAGARHANRVPDQRKPYPYWWVISEPGQPGAEFLDRRGRKDLEEKAKYECQYLKYDIRHEPLLRSIQVDGLEVGFITRNRYGAAVLNTDLLPMIDIDVRTDDGEEERWDPRLSSYVPRPYPVQEHELAKAMVTLTGAPFGRAIDVFSSSTDPAVLNLLHDWWPYSDPEHPENDPEGLSLTVNVFATQNGYRVVFNQPLVITPENCRQVEGLLRFCYSDPAYLRIACEQQLWRSRLTRKPWRTNEPEGQPLRFLYSVSSGVVSYAPAPPTDPLLAPLWEVLTADNREFCID